MKIEIRRLDPKDASELQALIVLTYQHTYRDLLTRAEIDTRVPNKFSLGETTLLFG